MIFWKVGYPNFFQEICFSGGKQTIHKVSAAFIVKNCHPRTSLKLKYLLKFIYFYVKLKVSIKRKYMLYSKDLTLKFFGLESRPFSFQVMSTSAFFGFSKI